MTRFEEIQAIVERNKNKKKSKISISEEEDLEVPGLTIDHQPTIEFATDEQDPDLVDQLYTKPRNIPNRGENASSWDSDY